MKINMPNMLTTARIVIIFIFLILASNSHGKPEGAVLTMRIVAYILAIIAGFTDLLDGYLARKWHQETDIGALLDPLADKIFVVAAMLMMIEFRLMPAWIAVVIIAREFLVTGLRMVASQKGEVIAADRWGKAKTLMQMIMLLIAGAAWIQLFPLYHEVGADKIVLNAGWHAFLLLTATVTILSGLSYFVKYRRLLLDGLAPARIRQK